MFKMMMQAARDRDLIPFLTEYGCDYSGVWLSPAKVDSRAYSSQAAAYMDLSLQQIEANLVSSTLWVFDLYNTAAHGDNWNNESASVLDTDHQLHDPDILARPYPMRSSARPSLLFFDSLRKHGVIMMEGKPASGGAPSIIYIPDEFQYGGGFDVHYTTGEIDWDGVNHLLYWIPAMDKMNHQIAICPKNGLDKNVLPRASRALLEHSLIFHPK